MNFNESTMRCVMSIDTSRFWEVGKVYIVNIEILHFPAIAEVIHGDRQSIDLRETITISKEWYDILKDRKIASWESNKKYPIAKTQEQVRYGMIMRNADIRRIGKVIQFKSVSHDFDNVDDDIVDIATNERYLACDIQEIGKSEYQWLADRNKILEINICENAIKFLSDLGGNDGYSNYKESKEVSALWKVRGKNVNPLHYKGHERDLAKIFQLVCEKSTWVNYQKIFRKIIYFEKKYSDIEGLISNQIANDIREVIELRCIYENASKLKTYDKKVAKNSNLSLGFMQMLLDKNKF